MRGVSGARNLFYASCRIGQISNSTCPGLTVHNDRRYFFSGVGSSLRSQSQYPPNSTITPTMIENRNPRNLEKLRIGEKPLGWSLERESKSFWNKVTLDLSAKHISASVVHYLGQKPVNVSTREWCLKKYLYNTNDASAARLVGQVLAQRCLQAGITELACFFPEEVRSKEKINLFLSSIEEGGIALKEPDQIAPDWNIHHVETPDTPWAVHEDVNDTYDTAIQLREYEVRKFQNRNRREVFGEDNPLIKKIEKE